MDITVKSLGVISDDEHSFVKFVLLEENILVFGKCLWHKDLVLAFYGHDDNVEIIAAGVLPKDVSKVPLDGKYWGDWRSSGYEVTTPPEYRSTIQKVLSAFEQEINRLWGN
jgi:hypothetical protein